MLDSSNACSTRVAHLPEVTACRLQLKCNSFMLDIIRVSCILQGQEIAQRLHTGQRTAHSNMFADNRFYNSNLERQRSAKLPLVLRWQNVKSRRDEAGTNSLSSCNSPSRSVQFTCLQLPQAVTIHCRVHIMLALSAAQKLRS